MSRHRIAFAQSLRRAVIPDDLRVIRSQISLALLKCGRELVFKVNDDVLRSHLPNQKLIIWHSELFQQAIENFLLCARHYNYLSSRLILFGIFYNNICRQDGVQCNVLNGQTVFIKLFGIGKTIVFIQVHLLQVFAIEEVVVVAFVHRFSSRKFAHNIINFVHIFRCVGINVKLR